VNEVKEYTGCCFIWDQEGGYASPIVSVDNTDITADIEEWFIANKWPTGGEIELQITIKRVGDESQ